MNIRRGILSFLPVLAVGAAAALPPEVSISQQGNLTIDRSKFEVQLFSPEWRLYRYEIVRNQHLEPGRFGGRLEAEGISGSFEQTVTELGQGKFRLQARYHFDPPYRAGSLRGYLTLPLDLRSVTIDGTEVALPKEVGKTIYSVPGGKNHEITIVYAPGRQLTIRTDAGISVIDARQYKQHCYNLNFSFSSPGGVITDSELTLDFEYAKAVMRPVDISAAVNRSFADSARHDNWTGQGPENDLNMIPAGRLKKDAFEFDVLPTGEKSVIVLGGEKRREFQREARVRLPENPRGGALNLLHACAWPPLGSEPLGNIEVTFRDGSLQNIPIRQLVDCANWWAPQVRPNAWVVYEFQKVQNTVGLYGSSFALKRDDPVALRFKNIGTDVVWMIGAVSLSNIPVIRNSKTEDDIVTVAGKELLPVDFSGETVPGSPLDFSWVADHAPAGKNGFIKASPTGELFFERQPEKRVRLIGTNLCFSACFLEKAESDKLAVELCRQGYNAVRLHHIDGELGIPGAAKSTQLDPAKLDKLDYLVAACKKQGIYLTLDLHSCRRIRSGDNVAGSFNPAFEVSAMTNWKEYTRNLLTRKNPYTGLAYAEDPAFFAIVLLNENNLLFQWRGAMGKCLDLFAAWKKQHGVTGEIANNNNPDFQCFLAEMEVKAVQEEIRFCREELGVKSLLSGLAIGAAEYPSLAGPRNRLDIIDNHVYFDHPSYPEQMWKLPEAHSQQNPLRTLNSMPCYIAPTRIVGKPFMVTEYAYCYPNRYRAAGGPMMGAYSALQGYNALFYFDWAPHRLLAIRTARMANFDIAGDPIARLSQKLLAAMFVREDIATAKEKVAVRIGADYFKKHGTRGFSGEFQLLSRITGIGSYVDHPAGALSIELDQDREPAALPTVIESAWRRFLREKIAISSTGQIHLDAGRGLFKVSSPRCEALCLDSGTLSGQFLKVANVNTFSAIGVVSLDRKPLVRSGKILLLHLTNMVNSNEIMNSDWTLVRKTGAPPPLARRGSAEIRLVGWRAFHIKALSADGKVLGEVQGKTDNGDWIFTVDNGRFPGVPAAYELNCCER